MGFLEAGLGLYQGLRGEQLQRDTNALNYEMWQKQLEYDKPVNQVARLKEAGLNPALMYGTGSTANTSAPLPRAEAPQPARFGGTILDPGSVVAIQQARVSGQQAALIREQARALKRENDILENTPGALKGDSVVTREGRRALDAFRSSEFGQGLGNRLGTAAGAAQLRAEQRGVGQLFKDAAKYWGSFLPRASEFIPAWMRQAAREGPKTSARAPWREGGE